MTDAEKRKRKQMYNLKWRQENPEKQREHNRKWREEHPDYAREYGRKQREKRMEEWERLERAIEQAGITPEDAERELDAVLKERRRRWSARRSG